MRNFLFVGLMLCTLFVVTSCNSDVFEDETTSATATERSTDVPGDCYSTESNTCNIDMVNCHFFGEANPPIYPECTYYSTVINVSIRNICRATPDAAAQTLQNIDDETASFLASIDPCSDGESLLGPLSFSYRSQWTVRMHYACCSDLNPGDPRQLYQD